MLIDTDALIWYLRGNKNAQKVIHANIPFRISVINYMELIQGMKNKRELLVLQKCLKQWSIEIIQINENISTRAMFFMEDYHLSNSMELGDAIIAASVLENHEVLLTANGKHYGFIPNMRIEIFKP